MGIPHGGRCPKGRHAENGTIPESYKLKQTETSDYDENTKLNIRDSDGTLVILPNKTKKITDGTVLTISEAQHKKKPLLLIYLSQNPDPETVVKWINIKKIKILNIAGPRESQSEGINKLSYEFLEEVMNLILSNENNNTVGPKFKSKL